MIDGMTWFLFGVLVGVVVVLICAFFAFRWPAASDNQEEGESW